MRFQLHIFRNGLPPTRVLWTWGKASATSSVNWDPAQATIAQLLEDVNETIPLEAAEWGLEDYVVEVKGFECLHFHEASSVLRDGDEVLIRPLSTTDLRARKFSGRHQISYDGKHLIDGVAFGRPLLRQSANRPAISIAPRKRRRLTYDEENLENISPPTALQRFDNRNPAENGYWDEVEGDTEYLPDGDFDDDDGDFQIFDEGDDRSWSESSDVAEDSAKENRAEASNELARLSPAGDVEVDHSVTPGRQRTTSRRSARLNSGPFPAGGGSALGIVDGQGRAFPPGDLASTPLSKQASSMRGPSTEASTQLHSPEGKLDTPVAPRYQSSGSAKRQKTASGHAQSPRSTPGSSKSVRFEGIEILAPEKDSAISNNDIDSDEDSEDDSDDDFELASPSPSADDEDPRDDVSNSDVESSVASTSTNSSSSESESSESDPSSNEGEDRSSLKRKIEDSTRDPRDHSNHVQPLKAAWHTPPGQGQKSTKKRNERRRRHKRLQYLDRVAETRQDATLQDTEHSKDANDPKNDLGKPTSRSKKDVKADFETKRQELLASLANGGIELNDQRSKDSDIENLEANALERSQHDNTPVHGVQHDEHESAEDGLSQPEEQSSKERPKLDMDSSKRLLFGSLGLRKPKTKQNDKQKLARKPQEEDVLASGHLKFDNEGEVVSYRSQDDIVQGNHLREGLKADKVWEQKILLSAVECVDEDVDLSVPPYPFRQRWDIQYQRPRTKGKNGKKRKRSEYQEEDSPAIHSSQYSGVAGLSYEDTTPHLNYDEDLSATIQDSQIDNAARQQLLKDIVTTNGDKIADEEDLPPVPSDPSECPALIQPALGPGLVIFFKQLMMKSDWQPEISNYRTATVDEILDDGTIQLTLAKRDREQKEVFYDEDTGQKLYDKFEMPDDEGDDAAAEGLLELAFSELIEPRILKDNGNTIDETSTKPPSNAVNTDASVDEDSIRNDIVPNGIDLTDGKSPPEMNRDGTEGQRADGMDSEAASSHKSAARESHVHKDLSNLELPASAEESRNEIGPGITNGLSKSDASRQSEAARRADADDVSTFWEDPKNNEEEDLGGDRGIDMELPPQDNTSLFMEQSRSEEEDGPEEPLDSPKFYGLDSSFHIDQDDEQEILLPEPSESPYAIQTPVKPRRTVQPGSLDKPTSKTANGDGHSSDSEFPSIDTLFSTARTSFESPKYKVKVRVSEDPPSTIKTVKYPRLSLEGFDGVENGRSGDRRPEDSNGTPGALDTSHYVDLTQASDEAAHTDEEDLLIYD
ncbi:MAG: hypothetical protein M4579_002883 [Chaenotheca gracillima]|nr:MAG: hypothetical protein M4579_002883 [Chaenotheca gracillima]